MPAWMNDVACWLRGGRFAVETREGTVIAELGDIIVRYRDGEAQVVRFPSRPGSPRGPRGTNGEGEGR